MYGIIGTVGTGITELDRKWVNISSVTSVKDLNDRQIFKPKLKHAAARKQRSVNKKKPK